MKVLVTGSSGFIGQSLCSFFLSKGYEITHLKRGKKGPLQKNSIYWNPETGEGNVADFEGFDAVIHLAGESLAQGFWTQAKKQRILESRKLGTERLVALLKKTEFPPKVFLSTSAIGYYGSRKDPMTENEEPGKGFLSEVCQAWEKASFPLRDKGVRVVYARLGLVLSRKGGILKALLPLFQLGFGGRLGDGKQIVSWVALEDVIKAFDYILREESMVGPVNVVSPNPVLQEQFAEILCSVLDRPCFFKIPKWLIFGEKAEALILSSVKVIPAALLKAGFSFSYPDFEKTLCYLLK